MLDILRAAVGPVGVREVAQQLGLHFNTARFHLEALVGAGHGPSRGTEGRQAPGRPRIGDRAVATARAEGDATGCSPRMLTSMIAGNYARAGEGGEEQARVGRTTSADQPLAVPAAGPRRSRRAVNTTMDRILGFAPDRGRRWRRYRLACGIVVCGQGAETLQGIVCSSTWGRCGGTRQDAVLLGADRLVPFVEPRPVPGPADRGGEARACRAMNFHDQFRWSQRGRQALYTGQASASWWAPTSVSAPAEPPWAGPWPMLS